MKTLLRCLATLSALHFTSEFAATVWATSPTHIMTLGGMNIALMLITWGAVR
jgi:hypothetical protein